MSQLNTTSFKNLYGASGTVFPDNTTQEISEGDMRTFGENVADSYLNIVDAQVGVVKATDAQIVGNVGTGEDTIMGYVIAANLLANNGESLLFRVHGSYGATSNSKTLKVKLGATTIFTKVSTSNGSTWTLEIEIIRTGASAEKCNVKYMTSGGALDSVYSTATEDLTSSLLVAITGEATADNDIVKQVAKVIFERAGTYSV